MVHPLSFEEYLAFSDAFGIHQSTEEHFASYLKYGGMPSLFALRDRTDDNIVRELSAIMDTVVLNDVARRLNLRDIALLQRLISYLFSTSGNLFSTNKVVLTLDRFGTGTTDDGIRIVNVIDWLLGQEG